MLSQSEHDAFITDGFIIRRAALTATQIEEYRAAVTRVVARCETADGYADVRRGPGGMIWGVNNILHPSVREPALLSALGEPEILGVIADLVGPDLQHHLCTLLVSPEGMSYRCHWHRDTQYDRDGEEAALRAALRSHVQLNGALRADSSLLIVPGSHVRAMTPAERDVLSGDPNGPMPGQMTVDLAAGDLAFYNSNLLHRGECSADVNRQTLHYAVHPFHPDAPTGGPAAQPWLTDPEFLGTLPQSLRALFSAWMRCG